MPIDVAIQPSPYEQEAPDSFRSRKFSFAILDDRFVSNQDNSQQSLINLFLTTLFTRRGEIPADQNAGTAFKDILINYNESSLVDDIAISLLEAEKQIKARQTENLGQQTQNLLSRIELAGVQLTDSGTVRVLVKLITRTGSEIRVQVI